MVLKLQNVIESSVKRGTISMNKTCSFNFRVQRDVCLKSEHKYLPPKPCTEVLYRVTVSKRVRSIRYVYPSLTDTFILHKLKLNSPCPKMFSHLNQPSMLLVLGQPAAVRESKPGSWAGVPSWRRSLLCRGRVG